MFLADPIESKLRRTLPWVAGMCVSAALLIAFTSFGLKDPLGRLPRSIERRAFPDFTLPALNGQPWTLSGQRGNIVLVNFFGTFCGPCRLEIPELIEIAVNYGGRGVRVVGISLDEHPSETVAQFVQHFRIPYPVLTCHPHCQIYDSIVGVGHAGQMGSATEGVPVTLLIDRNGLLSRVYYGYYGLYQDRLLRRDLQQLLSEPYSRSAR